MMNWLLQQNYYRMLKNDKTSASKDQENGMVAVKLSNFTPSISQHNSRFTRYSELQRVEQRRTMVHTSFCHARSINPTESPQSRGTKTSQASRLSQYVQREVMRLHEDSPFSEFEPMVRDKIRELKKLMLQREVALRNPRNKIPQKFFFSEYKMKGVQDQEEPLSATLHSRKGMESPFMRTINPRRIINHDVEQNQLEDTPRLSEEKRKIIMVGGGLSFRQVSTDETQLQFPSPVKLSERQTSRSSHRYYIRSGLSQMRQKPQEAIPENDCKPWEIHKLEHLQQYGM